MANKMEPGRWVGKVDVFANDGEFELILLSILFPGLHHTNPLQNGAFVACFCIL